MTAVAGDALSHGARRHWWRAIFGRLWRAEFTACPTTARASSPRAENGNRSAPLCMGRMSSRRERPRPYWPLHIALLAKTMAPPAMTSVISIYK
jgi:hypothetical protein